MQKACDRIKPYISFECIGGETTSHIFSLLQDHGVLYHYGNLSLRAITNIQTKDLIFCKKILRGFWLFDDLMDKISRESLFDNYVNLLKLNPSIFESNIQASFLPQNYEEAFKCYKAEMGKGKVLFDFTNEANI
jgi:hypothetical protein